MTSALPAFPYPLPSAPGIQSVASVDNNSRPSCSSGPPTQLPPTASKLYYTGPAEYVPMDNNANVSVYIYCTYNILHKIFYLGEV